MLVLTRKSLLTCIPFGAPRPIAESTLLNDLLRPRAQERALNSIVGLKAPISETFGATD